MLECGVDEKILHLGKSEESRRVDDVDTQDVSEPMVIEVEGILHREQAVTVAVHDAGVLDHVDVLRWPAGRDVAHDYLLEETPIAGEAYEERGRFVDMGRRRGVPFWYRGKVAWGAGFGGERKVINDGGWCS